MNQETYINELEIGLRNAFFANDIAIEIAEIYQGYQVILFKVVLVTPTSKQINQVMNMAKSIEQFTDTTCVRIMTKGSFFLIELPAQTQIFLYSHEMKGSELKVPVGRKIADETHYVDFLHDSHLISLGITNSGKSFAVKNILFHLLRQNPSMHLVISGQKRSNWIDFEQIATVIYDNQQTLLMLNNLLDIMKERNRKMITKPYIFVVLDDFLNLANTKDKEFNKEVIDTLCELFTLSRESQIHFIITSQRMTDIDRRILGNCSAKLLFSVSDNVDSNVIGGSGGLALDKLGKFKGDCILKTNNGLERIASGYLEKSVLQKLAELLLKVNTVKVADFAEIILAPQNDENSEFLGGVENSPQSAKITVNTIENSSAKYTQKQLRDFKLSGQPNEEHFSIIRAIIDFMGSKNKAGQSIWNIEKPGSNHYKWMELALQGAN